MEQKEENEEMNVLKENMMELTDEQKKEEEIQDLEELQKTVQDHKVNPQKIKIHYRKYKLGRHCSQGGSREECRISY